MVILFLNDPKCGIHSMTFAVNLQPTQIMAKPSHYVIHQAMPQVHLGLTKFRWVFNSIVFATFNRL